MIYYPNDNIQSVGAEEEEEEGGRCRRRRQRRSSARGHQRSAKVLLERERENDDGDVVSGFADVESCFGSALPSLSIYLSLSRESCLLLSLAPHHGR